MTPDALRAKLRDHEDNFVERKPAGVNRAEMRKTLVAFANSVPQGQTAILFIGVRDDGSLNSVKAPDSVQKTLNDICARDCYPAIPFRATALTQDGATSWRLKSITATPGRTSPAQPSSSAGRDPRLHQSSFSGKWWNPRRARWRRFTG